ncbi:hypothetical protein TSMEX_010472 [Taenia solium]|eukprot:TsM_000214400 transcript=TsM_000214400 gene=TsM_000214400
MCIRTADADDDAMSCEHTCQTICHLSSPSTPYFLRLDLVLEITPASIFYAQISNDWCAWLSKPVLTTDA